MKYCKHSVISISRDVQLRDVNPVCDEPFLGVRARMLQQRFSVTGGVENRYLSIGFQNSQFHKSSVEIFKLFVTALPKENFQTFRADYSCFTWRQQHYFLRKQLSWFLFASESKTDSLSNLVGFMAIVNGKL